MFPSQVTVLPGLGADELEDVPLERVEAELCGYAARLAAGTCRYLLLVAEFDRRGGAATWGMSSTAAWLAWRGALDRRTAREHVRVARALRALPEVTAAFAAGEVAFAKVRALTRMATPATEGELVELARHATCDELDRIITTYRRDTDGDLAKAIEQHERRFCSTEYDDDGMHVTRAEVPPAEGAVVETALDAAREVLKKEDAAGSGSAEPPQRSSAQLRADAFVHIFECFLADTGARTSDDDRFLVLLNAEIEPDPDQGGGVRGEVVGGPGLSTETLRRYGCSEPSALLVRDSNGNPLWMSRKIRNANRAQRRALAFRHGGHCGWLGCGVRSRLVPHHSHEWGEGGPTDIDSMLPLCRHHHYLVHELGFRIDVDGRGGFRFFRPDGTELVPPRSYPVGGSGASEVGGDAGDVGGGLSRGDEVLSAPAPGDREPFDLDLTMTAMRCLFHPAATTTAAEVAAAN